MNFKELMVSLGRGVCVCVCVSIDMNCKTHTRTKLHHKRPSSCLIRIKSSQLVCKMHQVLVDRPQELICISQLYQLIAHVKIFRPFPLLLLLN